MPLYKANPQFSVWCDTCGNLEDYRPFANRAIAIKKFRSLGWVIGKKVLCPECAAPNKSANPTLLKSAPLEALSTPEHSATSQTTARPQQRG